MEPCATFAIWRRKIYDDLLIRLQNNKTLDEVGDTLAEIQGIFGFRCYYVLDMSRLVEEEPISSLFPFNIASSLVYKLDEGLIEFASHLFTHSPETLGPIQWELSELEATGCVPPAVMKSFRAFDLIRGADFPALGMFGAPRIIGFAGDRPPLDVDELESLSVLMFQLHARLSVIGNARTEKKAPLTSLEREILSLASDGESFETISTHMELSSRTINYLVDSICKKMEVATVEHAVALTLRRRLAS